MTQVTLNSRQIVEISGDDSFDFLQGIVTSELTELETGTVAPCALLTPQGKILFEFLISSPSKNHFLVDIERALVAGFMKRMALYRLRAKVDIRINDELFISAIWDENLDQSLRDLRFLGEKSVGRKYSNTDTASGELAEYNKQRVLSGVCEMCTDYQPSDMFPHDVSMDINGTISFKKGCFIGQEVVSRMRHRGTARKRVMHAQSSNNLIEGETQITIDGKSIGAVTSFFDNQAIAIVRADKVAKNVGADNPTLVGRDTVELSFYTWSGLALDQFLQLEQKV